MDAWGQQLWNCAQRGCQDEVERLLVHGVPAAQAALARALRVSAVNDHVATTALLLARAGPAELFAGDDDGRSVVCAAASAGSVGALSLFLAVQPPTAGQYDASLRTAARTGHGHVVQLLVAHRVDVNACDSVRNTVLGYAADRGDVAMVKCLLEIKADANGCEFTPLQWCAARHCSVCLAQPLAAVPVAACVHGAVAALLLGHKADVDRRGVHSYSALCLACDRGHIGMVAVLLDGKASLEQPRGWQGNTPLACAVLHWHKHLASFLLGRGANIDCVDFQGRTPLAHVCARVSEPGTPCTRLDMVEFLLVSKASVNVRDTRNKTPLDLARRAGSDAVAALLATNRTRRRPRMTQSGVNPTCAGVHMERRNPCG